MKTELQEAMASGVLVEFHDSRGNTVEQVVYTAWHGRPLPDVGDAVCCSKARSPTSPAGRRTGKLRGRVVSRHFEIQHGEQGQPEVWVRLVLAVVPSPASPKPRHKAASRFSTN